MTTLNTEAFKYAYNALNKAQYPNSHTASAGYVALATMLEVCVNWKMGISQILKELSEIILDRYTPFAFKCECECNNEHPECASAKVEMYQQFDTVQRIAKYISEYNPEH